MRTRPYLNQFLIAGALLTSMSGYGDTGTDNGFTTIVGPVAKTLSTSLQHLIMTERPTNIGTPPGAITVSDQNGDPAIICSTTVPNCMFSNKLNEFSHQEKTVDATVFKALYKTAMQVRTNEKFVKIQNLKVGGNINLTSITIEDSFVGGFKVPLEIDCGAYPSRNAPGEFEYARCDYEVGTAESNPEAYALYEAIKTNSELSKRIQDLESDPRLELGTVKILEKVSWKPYQWQELRVFFKAKPIEGEIPESGALASVRLNIFVNGIAEDGNVRIEKSSEHYDRFIPISPRK